MHNQSKILTLVLSSLLVVSQAEASTFSSMYVFGDSLSDGGASPSSPFSIYHLLGGNCDPAHPCSPNGPYVDGHYSNGPTAVEYLANAILPGGANPGNFINLAVAGSTTGIGNFGDGGSQSTVGAYELPGMAQQVGYYLQNLSGGVGDDALHVVWGGANDFLTFDSPQAAAQNIAGYVGLLAGSGADYILVPNIPDLSQTPFVQSSGTDAINAALGFTLGFNQALADQLDGLAAFFPATHIAQFDTFSFFNGILQNPGAYGFTNATDACVNLPSVCLDPEQHIYWDGFHPTTQLHALTASAMLSQVPLPGAMIFFLTGLVAWFSQGVRRRA